MQIHSEWDLKQLYTSANDPRIEKDIRGYERAYAAFEKRYRKNRTWHSSPKSLLQALQDYERFIDAAMAWKPLFYFGYRHALNTTDIEAEARMRLIEERAIKASNRIHFFELGIGMISKVQQKAFLTHKLLKPYRYFLEKVFEAAKHQLSESEEKLMALTSGPSRSMWVSGVSGAVSRIMVPWQGKEIPINDAFERIPIIQNVAERRELWHTANRLMWEKTGDFAEAEINAIYTQKKISDELRKFKKPYDASLLGYENTESMVTTLVETVHEHAHIVQEFYTIKKKLLGLDQLEPADAGAEIGTAKTQFPFEEAVKLVRNVFAGVKPEYGAVVERYAREGRIDAYPKKGKGGGAFFSGAHKLPGFVFLNYINDIGSVTGLAHELGHALHDELAKAQPVLYEDYTISAAEIASTFFEELVLQHLIKTLPAEEQKFALHESVLNTLGNVLLSSADFRFELDLHNRIRTQGFVPKEAIAALHVEHMRPYRGTIVREMPESGYVFIRKIHYRIPFYSYPYSFGKLVSRAMVARYQKDPTYIEKIEQFFRGGKSDSPENMLRRIGINTNKAFFEEGIVAIKADIARLAHITGVH